MWDTIEFARTGSRNREKGLKCQDFIAYAEHDTVQVITLADGTGDDDYARLGAGRSCQVLAALLSENYEQIYKMEEDHIQFNVAANTKTELILLCDRYGIDIKQLQSTLMGVAIDHKSGTFLAVHLGDGKIIFRRNDVCRTLSGPENGRTRRHTFLTSMQKMGSHVRIRKGRIDDIQLFMLLSDGWLDVEYEKEPAKLYEAVGNKKYLDMIRDHVDDLSCISLYCKPEMNTV